MMYKSQFRKMYPYDWFCGSRVSWFETFFHIDEDLFELVKLFTFDCELISQVTVTTTGNLYK